jgi:hypothetical protein
VHLEIRHHVRPVERSIRARDNETRPVIRVLPARIVEHGELHLAQGFAAASALREGVAIGLHQLRRRALVDRPEAHHLRFSAGEDQSATQPVDAVAGFHVAHARLAGGKNDELGAMEIQARGFKRGEQTMAIAAGAAVGARERDAGFQERVVEAGVLRLRRTRQRFEVAVGADMQKARPMPLLEARFGGLGAEHHGRRGETGRD